MENKDYLIIFLTIAIISFVLYSFRYEFGIVSGSICPPPITCPSPITCPPPITCPKCPPISTALDCKFLSNLTHDWPIISEQALVGTWESNISKQKFIFNLNKTIDGVHKNNSIIPFGYYFNTSYIIRGTKSGGVPHILFYNSGKNTLYVCLPDKLVNLDTHMDMYSYIFASTDTSLKNLPQFNDILYGSVWKAGNTLTVISKDKIHWGILEDNKFIKKKEVNIKVEKENDGKGNDFYIFSEIPSESTPNFFYNKLLYYNNKSTQRLYIILQELHKIN